jgi:hypothetical protein
MVVTYFYMTQKKILAAIIFLMVSVVAFPSFAQKKWPGIVLYSIEKNSITNNFIIDPAVRISKGQYSYPVPTPPEIFEAPDAQQVLEGLFRRFCREEYPRGKKFELYVDGNKCGTALVTNLDTMNSCSAVISEVTLSYIDSTVRSFKGHGLVIAAAHPKKPIPKFPIDSVLEASILQYGKEEFLRRGVKKEIADKGYIFELRSTDLDGDGKPEYLVTYYIIGEEVRRADYEADMQYSLTAILEPDGNSFKLLFAHYPDPGTSIETHYYHFVDVLDFAGDGVCSVILQKRNASTWDYILVQKKGDTWEELYEGAGGGC